VNRADQAMSLSKSPPCLNAGALTVCLRFCTVKDFAACQAVCKFWLGVADSDQRWAELYERTQRVLSEASPRDSLRALIHRPFGQEAVGWRLSVLRDDILDPDTVDYYATGRVTAYDADNDAYLVVYEDERSNLGEVWEREKRIRTSAMHLNPSLMGKSRFRFLAPPGDTCSNEEGAMQGDIAASTMSVLEATSWKLELRRTVQNAPLNLLQRIDVHTDEVLFVVFSPCGSRLASCSRDNTTRIFRCTGEGHDFRYEEEAVFIHETAPCRAVWWPVAPYDTLLVVLQADGGDYQTSTFVEGWRITSCDTAKVPEDGLKEVPEVPQHGDAAEVAEVPEAAVHMDCEEDGDQDEMD